MELILGLIFATSWVMVAPKVLADAITTLRASKAGKWDLIDKDRDRRATRSERRSAAVAAVRKRRNKEAGGSGAYEPGFRKYARDVYTGFWKRQCEKLAAKEKARPPYVYDPNRPGLRRRMRDGVVKRTSRLVDQAGGVGRLLIDPVGERRQPADVVPPRPGGRGDDGSVGTPVDPWPSDGDEPTVELAAGTQDRAQAAAATHQRADTGTPPAEGVRRRPSPSPRQEKTAATDGWTGMRTNQGDPMCQVCLGALRRTTDGWAACDRCATAPDPDRNCAAPTLSDQARMRNELYGKCAHRTVRQGFPDQWCNNPFDGTNPYCREHRTTAAPTRSGASTSNGGTTMTAPATTEINTNEDARQAFAAMAAAAAEANDAIAALEAAKAKMAAAANGTADGMSAKAFDVDATTAATEAADVISLGTLADWSERIDAVEAAADRGMKALDKYRDSEDMVASNNIDPSTLAATSS